MGSPARVPHFSPNEMSLIGARVCRTNLPVCFLIRELDSFAFAREESALRLSLFSTFSNPSGFAGCVYAGPSYAVLRVPRVIGVGSGGRPFSIPRVLTVYPFRTPDGASYECNAGDWSLLGPLRDPRTHCHL